MRLAVEVSRLLLYKTVLKLQEGESVTLEAAMLKLRDAQLKKGYRVVFMQARS